MVGAPGDVVVPYRATPGVVELHLPDLKSLFDTGTTPAYPHAAAPVEPSVASYLLRCARAQRRRAHLELVVTLRVPPSTRAEEASARSALARYFANEAELARLDSAVNRTEGIAAFRYAVPVILVAGLFAGLFYTQLGTESARGLLLALGYLVLITVVWVMLWDPMELLLFDSFFLRLKARALRKLAAATVRFTTAA